MGKRKKKNKGSDGSNKRFQNFTVPVPDDHPNWPERERHEVMMSVFMERVPQNFERDYIAVICPVAKRRTVVSRDGWTCSYNKLLNMDRKFQSALPGGNLHDIQWMRFPNMCILDCLHFKAERTFYILDLMQWRQFQHYESEAEFRFHWIEQVEDEKDLISITPVNEYHFKSMPRLKCTQESLYRALENTTFKVDGVLFFRRFCPYTPGTRKSVLWLPPKDIQSVLGWTPPSNVLPSREKQTSTPAASGASASVDA